MSAFELEISEEEERSGFELGAPDDESFKLQELDEYPGTLPDFDIEEQPMIPVEEEKEDILELEEEPEDLPEEEEPTFELDDDNDEDEFESAGAFVDSDDVLDSETYDENEFSDNETLGSNDEIESLSEDEVSELGGSPSPDDEIETVSADVDPELQALLQSELQRSEEIKASKGEVGLPEEDRIETVYKEFIPVEEQEDLEAININDEEGSETGQEEFVGVAPPITADSEDTEGKRTKRTKPKAMSKRRMYAIIGTPIFLMLILLGLGYFKVINVPGIQEISAPDTVASNNDLVIDDVDDIIIPEESTEQSSEIQDTVLQEESSKEDIKTQVEAVDKPKEIAKVEEKTEKLDLVKKENPIKKNIKPVKKVKKDKPLVEANKTKKKEVKSGKNEKNKKVSIPKSNRKPDSDVGLFTVQIYASPSKKDAEDWLNKLKSDNINDAFISEQLVRDEVWYRVRFGGFKTKQEAQAAAQKLGYSQTWVDRVK